VVKRPEDVPVAERGVAAAPGRLLAGKYRLGRLLGEGGMGSVYEAEHVGLGARVAVKLLSPACAANDRAVLRFRREARAAAAVKHENIVVVTDTDTDEDGVPFIVMELLDGESLSGWIQRKRILPVRTAAGIATQILAGLAVAHQRKVIHRDLKPANVLLARQRDGTYVAKVLDFGISKFLEDGAPDVTATQTVVGTPRFMSPEQALGQRDVDGRADLYAVGEMLYYMTTGRLPFSATTVEELSQQIINGDFPAPHTVKPSITGDLEAVILCAMATKRELRYPDAAAMLAALRAAVPNLETQLGEDSSGLVTPVPTSQPSVTPAPSLSSSDIGSFTPASSRPPVLGRRRWLALAAGLAMAAVGAGWLVRRQLAPAATAGPGAAVAATAAAPTGELRFGISRYMPEADVQRAHGPFVDYLGRRLGRPVRLVILDDYLSVATKLAAGEVDLAALSAYNYIEAKRATPGLRLLATPVTSGGSSYEGVILVRADSGIATLADLRGKRFCWVSAHSSSGYLYARALFRRAGIDPNSAFAGSVLTGDHLSSLRDLRDHTCDGAAVFSAILFEAREHGIAPETFRILASTDRIPYDAYVMSPAASEELVKQIREAILAITPGSPVAGEVFTGGSILGFGPVTDSAYAPVRDIEKFLEQRQP
jgi:serine/threonine-protein kinase